jgi:hypothetical protein
VRSLRPLSREAKSLFLRPNVTGNVHEMAIGHNPLPTGCARCPAKFKSSRWRYVFVQDIQGTIFVLPDGPHLHPRVLGGGRPALYAGDLTIQNGNILDVTNLSGTFQCDNEEGLKEVADQIRRQGVNVEVGAVRFFPPNGSFPVILE